jgi:cytochrome c556
VVASVCRLRLGALLLVLWIVTWLGQPAHATGDSTGGWLPDAIFIKLFDDSLKNIQDFARSESSLNQKANDLESEAYYLMMLAEVAKQTGLNGWSSKVGVLQAHAADLALAARRKDLTEVKKQAGLIADLKKPETAGGATPRNLAQAVPIQNLMKQVQNLHKKHQDYRRLSAAAFGQRGKTDEIHLAAYRMAVYAIAIHAHVPTKDLPKDKSAKDWEGACEDMRKACLDIAQAAKAKKQSDVKNSILKLEASCNRCHRDFRVDVD